MALFKRVVVNMLQSYLERETRKSRDKEISEEQRAEHFKGFQIVDCCVGSKGRFHFSLQEDPMQREGWEEGDPLADDESLERRVVTFTRGVLGKRWEHVTLPGGENFVAGVSRNAKTEFVGINTDGAVYVIGGGHSGFEDDIASAKMNGITRGLINSTRTIEGVLYVAGSGRSVGYREGKNRWVSLTQMMPYEYQRDWRTAGFKDIDGFARNDIYCVGGKGDVRHFDGQQWRHIPFPKDLDLYSVCCAGDGFVYISGYGGTTYRGRGDHWTQIYEGTLAPFNDMGWYEGKVWCTNREGVWTIEGNEIEPADGLDWFLGAHDHLDIADGILLVAGRYGAAYKEKGAWHVIF